LSENQLKFRLEDISTEGQETIINESAEWLEDRLAHETFRFFYFVTPIKLHLHLRRSGRIVILTSALEFTVKWVCARCLDSFVSPMKAEYTTTLRPKPDRPLAQEVELTREDLETEFYEGEEIDLTNLLQDQVLLTIPPKVLCKEDCRGLCPKCGKNLNREVCQCAEKDLDPRWAALKSFRAH